MILFFLFCLLLTIIVESGIYFYFIRESKVVVYSSLINTFTLPLATYFYLIYRQFVFTEIIVFLAETILIKYLIEVSYRKAVSVSFYANLLTALVGLLI